MGFSPCILSVNSFPKLSLVFKSDELKPRYLDLKILAWKLKGHNRSAQKSQNGFFLISSLFLIELIATNEIHQLPVLRGGEESQEDILKITSDENSPEA